MTTKNTPKNCVLMKRCNCCMGTSMHGPSRNHACMQASSHCRPHCRPLRAGQGNGMPAPDIRLIASDVDGTLLNSRQELTPAVERAVALANSVGVPVPILVSPTCCSQTFTQHACSAPCTAVTMCACVLLLQELLLALGCSMQNAPPRRLGAACMSSTVGSRCSGACVLPQLVVATGKAPGCAWTKKVLPRLGPPAPGVFMQGLLVYDAAGNLIHSRSLERATADACIVFAAEHGEGHTCFDSLVVC